MLVTQQSFLGILTVLAFSGIGGISAIRCYRCKYNEPEAWGRCLQVNIRKTGRTSTLGQDARIDECRPKVQGDYEPEECFFFEGIQNYGKGDQPRLTMTCLDRAAEVFMQNFDVNLGPNQCVNVDNYFEKPYRYIRGRVCRCDGSLCNSYTTLNRNTPQFDRARLVVAAGAPVHRPQNTVTAFLYSVFLALFAVFVRP